MNHNRIWKLISPKRSPERIVQDGLLGTVEIEASNLYGECLDSGRGWTTEELEEELGVDLSEILDSLAHSLRQAGAR